MPLFSRSPQKEEKYQRQRFKKIRAALGVVKQRPHIKKIEILYELVDDHPLGEALDAAISFPGNLGLRTTANDRELARLVIFLTGFHKALDGSSDLVNLRRKPLDENTDPDGQAFPKAGKTSEFTAYIIRNRLKLVEWAERCVDVFIAKSAEWTNKFDPQSIINRGQNVINEENAGKFIDVNNRITDLERRMVSVEIKIGALEISHEEFKSRVGRDLNLLTIQQRVLESTLIQTKDRLDVEISVRKLQIENVNADVAANNVRISLLEQEVQEIRVSVLAVVGDAAAEKVKLAALTERFNALQRDFLEQCGLLAEVAVGTWLTMETVSLQWGVTSRVVAATEQVRLLLAGQIEAKSEYDRMLSTANWKEELLLNALDVVLMAAETATPLPFNLIVKFIRTNRKYVIGTPRPTSGTTPTEESEDSDGGDDSVNPVERLVQSARTQADSRIEGAIDGIKDKEVRAFVTAQVSIVEAAVSEKAVEVIENYFKFPIFEAGWSIPAAPTFDTSIELAKNETIRRLHERMDSAIKGMLNRKKLKYAVQAAYYASGGNEVGGLTPRVAAERVFGKVKAAFDPTFQQWDLNLLSVLQSGRKEQIKEAFLVLFLGSFMDANASRADSWFTFTVDSLPEPLVAWLKSKGVVRAFTTSFNSMDCYYAGYVPWDERRFGSTNRNHSLVVLGVFRKILRTETSTRSRIEGLFSHSSVNLFEDIGPIIYSVGSKVESLKTTDLWGRRRASVRDVNALIPAEVQEFMDQEGA